MADDKPDPSTPSGDYNDMHAKWEMVQVILDGVDAVKAAGKRYLPKYEKESEESWRARRDAAPWRPEFDDALRALCAKPFTKPVSLQGEQSQAVKDFAEDVDGRGHNQHVFIRDTFREGVAKGLVGVYVTYPDGEPARTRSEELAQGNMPYWVALKAETILACYTKSVNGREVVEHIRYKEDRTLRDGFGEVTQERVRVLELDEAGRPTSRVWIKGKDTNDWFPEDEPVILAGVDEIPVVLFFTGERSGNYRVKPPLIDLAHMQMELYRGHARKDEILTFAGSPMLKGTGISGLDESGKPIQVTVGPKTILLTPPNVSGSQPGDWAFIQPAAANITEIRSDLESTTEDFRRLAMQPSTPQSGTMVATGQAIDAAKAHSAIEAWAHDFQDGFEQVWVYTCQWLNEAETVEISIHTDFAVEIAGTADIDELLKMRMAGEISRETFWDELLRRGKLGPQFDPDEEKLKLEEEAPAFDPRLSVSALAEMAQLHGSDVGPGGIEAPALPVSPAGKPIVPPGGQAKAA
jgi:hypothetical protein